MNTILKRVSMGILFFVSVVFVSCILYVSFVGVGKLVSSFGDGLVFKIVFYGIWWLVVCGVVLSLSHPFRDALVSIFKIIPKPSQRTFRLFLVNYFLVGKGISKTHLKTRFSDSVIEEALKKITLTGESTIDEILNQLEVLDISFDQINEILQSSNHRMVLKKGCTREDVLRVYNGLEE